MDLLVRRARLRDRDGRWAIGIVGERIAAVESDELTGHVAGVTETATVLDADGGLVTESFIDAHLHLDKVYTFDRVGDAALAAYTRAGMGAAMTAIELAAEVKNDYDESWIYENARRAILDGLANGVLHVLAFADVDTKARLEGVKALIRLRDELAPHVGLEVVAFPQDGVIRDPGAEDYVQQAVEAGADRVGGIPWIEYTEDDAQEHVRRMCALAAAHGKRVAMLVDDAGDPTLRTTEMLAVELAKHRLRGGVACHARAMDLWPEPYFRRVTALAQRAGLGFVTDPHTGPVHLRAFDLAEYAIPVALGQDDIADAYYPYGRHNLLEVAFLASHLFSAVTTRDMNRLLDMITTEAARVLGIPHHALEVGAIANLAVHDASSVRELFAEHARPRYVISRGRLVASTEPAHTELDVPADR